MDKRNIIIGILSIACLVLGYMAFKPSPVTDNGFIKARVDSITKQNKTLLAGVEEFSKANEILKASIDSLKKLPPEIKTKYLTLYQTIDKLNNHDLKDTLDNIFVSNEIDTTTQDTLISITPLETKFLINEYYRNGELIELNKVCEDVNTNLLKELTNDSLAISDYKVVVKNYNEIVSLKDGEIQNLNSVVKEKNKIILRQKIFKWLAIVAGSVGMGYMGLQNLKHSP